MKYDIGDSNISWKDANGDPAPNAAAAAYGVLESTGNFVDTNGLVYKTKDGAVNKTSADAVYTTNIDTVSLDGGATTMTLGELQSGINDGTLNMEDFYAGVDADSVKTETDEYVEYIVRIPKLDDKPLASNQ